MLGGGDGSCRGEPLVQFQKRGRVKKRGRKRLADLGDDDEEEVEGATAEETERQKRAREDSPTCDLDQDRSRSRSRSRSTSPVRGGDEREGEAAVAAGETAEDEKESEPLPIVAFRKQITTAVQNNQFIVLVGETGSGKTTKLAQYILDAGLAEGKGDRRGAAIAVTQPRRVAAIGAAHRVSQERGTILGEEVGYTVRLESQCSGATRIKYLTDGCLLRECLLSANLEQYAVVILDEAHERSVATDIMFTLLKQAALRRPDLRVVVTSATLDHEKFSAYFNGCPVILVPGRQFPVEINWEPGAFAYDR